MSSTERVPVRQIRASDAETDGCADGCCAPVVAVQRDADWHHAARRAQLLSWLSLAYMSAEGAIGITASVLAGSVALLGFGLDSVIEGLASVIIIWGFTGTRTLSDTAEGRAQKAVGITFFLLAPYTLIAGDRATTSWLGIGLSISSLIVMPLLDLAKKRLGETGFRRDQRRGHPEPALRLPRRRRTRRSAGQHPAGLVVARPDRRARYRCSRRQ